MPDPDKFFSVAVVQSKLSIDPIIQELVLFIVGCIFTVLVCLFGIATNIINIPIFWKLGYQDGVNITLTALAICDLAGLIFELVYCILLSPYISDDEWFISKVALAYITGYTFEYFTRVSSVITAYAAIERCLCVTWPLKIKSLITNKVSVVVNGGIFIVISLYLFPVFYIMYIDWTYIPGRNRTMCVVYFNSKRGELFPINYYITDILLPYSIFFVLIACCTTLFVKLKSKAKWRQLASSSYNKSSHVNRKELKCARMFMTVSFMCVVLLLPHSVIFTFTIFFREIALGGAYNDLGRVIGTFTVLLKIFNSGFTIFIYYNMSTKYRLEFQRRFAKFWTNTKLNQEDYK
ncbi:hypothetical protein BgiMline_011693 [Biomphalaria glabrata]|nr:FMRFamide receptor-like [Biomphalaria glabrata]